MDPSTRRLRITERDRMLLEFLAEHRLVMAAHVQALLGVTLSGAMRRLRALVAAELTSTETVFHRHPPCFQITRQGLAVIESPLTKPRLDYRSYAHDVGVAWLWLAARQGLFGPRTAVISEREMRSRDGSERNERRRRGLEGGHVPFGVPLSRVRSGGELQLHYPDLLLIDQHGRRIAVELELTAKGRARREKIIGGYAADARIDVVLYMVQDPRLARAVQATARQFGFQDRLHVQPVRFSAGQVPAPGRSLQRERELPKPALRTRAHSSPSAELAL